MKKQWHTQSLHFLCDSQTFRQLIGAEGARLLRETLDRWDPGGVAEEAHRQPRGKRAPVAEINRYSLHPKATMFTKTAFFLEHSECRPQSGLERRALYSCGNRGKVETPQGKPEEARLPPRRKESACSGKKRSNLYKDAHLACSNNIWMSKIKNKQLIHSNLFSNNFTSSMDVFPFFWYIELFRRNEEKDT